MTAANPAFPECRQDANWEGEANQIAVAYCDTHKRPYLECKNRALEAELAEAHKTSSNERIVIDALKVRVVELLLSDVCDDTMPRETRRRSGSKTCVPTNGRRPRDEL